MRCISPFLLGSDVIQNDPSCCGVRQGERVRCISLLSLLRCYSKRLAMLRGMVGGRGLKSTFNILNSSIAVPRSITGCGVSYIGEVSQSDGRVSSTEMAGNIREIPARRKAQILQSTPMHSPYIADLSRFVISQKRSSAIPSHLTILPKRIKKPSDKNRTVEISIRFKY